MSFKHDKENECIDIQIGEGDICLNKETGGFLLFDIGGKCRVGQDLTPCFDSYDVENVKDRYVRIKGSYAGMRVVATMLLDSIMKIVDDKVVLPDEIQRCSTCGNRKDLDVELIDTGIYMICDKCLEELGIAMGWRLER